MKKIGIFGGTFNPPHLGHARLLFGFADRLSLDSLIVIPTFIPPHKRAKSLAPGADRLEMCRLAFGFDSRVEVSNEELERGGKSYTFDTLLSLRERHPADELFLIIGSDMLDTFEQWYRWRDILEMCTVCASSREDGRAMRNDLSGVFVADIPPLEMSSTEIRRRAAAGEPLDGLVSGEVEKYIREKGLYNDG